MGVRPRLRDERETFLRSSFQGATSFPQAFIYIPYLGSAPSSKIFLHFPPKSQELQCSFSQPDIERTQTRVCWECGAVRSALR